MGPGAEAFLERVIAPAIGEPFETRVVHPEHEGILFVQWSVT
jgi:hypothetical protein